MKLVAVILLFATPAFAQSNRLYSAHVRRVVDADTIQADLHLGCSITLHDQSIRFLACNAPERYTSNGIIATAIVKQWLPTNQPIELQIPCERDGSERKEKYGRWLSVINVGGTNLNIFLTTTHTNYFKP